MKPSTKSLLLQSIFILFSSTLYALDPAIETNMSKALLNGNQPKYEIKNFHQEVSRSYSEKDGLPASTILSIEVVNGVVYAGTSNGLAQFQNNAWSVVSSLPSESVTALASENDVLYAASGSGLWIIKAKDDVVHVDLGGITVNAIAVKDQTVYLASAEGLYILHNGQITRDDQLLQLLDFRVQINDVAVSGDNTVAVASEEGLFVKGVFQPWETVYPQDGQGRSWAPRNVKAVGYQNSKSLWFASPQGVGVLNENWTLMEGKDGLPYNDFTCLSIAMDHQIWFGTTMGAVRVNATAYEWHYRQGKRWLPDDLINDAVSFENQTWFATANGVGVIENVPITLAQKAEHYEQEIEQYIKRTEYGYLSEVGLKNPEDKSEIMYHDSDNDGLWTSMYGAGECYAYSATKSPEAKRRAQQAFKALRFLSTVTQGGEVEMQPGYVARTIVSTSEPNPNERSSYTLEGQKRNQENETLWKVYSPRFPLNKEGNYWFKTDTSSDELDGHYFFYGLYYDLVADTDEEKQLVRETVQAITDHLIRNDFAMIDHDGTPTRWAVFRPSIINRDFNWYPERGLNSLSMLAYLAVTEHVTGDARYGEISKQLQEEHYYDMNAMVAKIQYGPGSGNQSDDEMAYMSFYNLMKYCKDDALRRHILYSFFNYWAVDYPEMNPFFNFIYAACGLGETYTDPWGTYSLNPWDGWLDDSVKTLTGFSLDRRNWSHQNSHRIDLAPLPRQSIANYPNEEPNRLRAHRVNGKVIPVENRHFNHWNTDPWTLNDGGDGRGLASGTVYLLPYYMGLYYGFIQE